LSVYFSVKGEGENDLVQRVKSSENVKLISYDKLGSAQKKLKFEDLIVSIF